MPRCVKREILKTYFQHCVNNYVHIFELKPSSKISKILAYLMSKEVDI